MAFFHYRAVTPGGKVTEGTLEAVDKSTAMVQLEEQGQLPIKVLSSDAGDGQIWGFQLPWKRKRVRQQDLLVFTQELSTLVSAGLPLDRSLRILPELTENAYLAEIIQEILREIKGGKSLSEALGLHPQVFPKIYVNMIRAGEMGGALDNILERLQEYLENVEELKNYLLSSLIYPAILSFVGVASIVIMVTFVIPKFADIFDNAGAPIPLPMKIMLGISSIITGYWWIFLLVGVGVWYWIGRVLKTPQGRLQWDRRLLEVPVLGSVFQKMEVSRLSRTMGTLLNSSVPLIESINIVRDVVGNQAIASAMETVKAGVKKGEGLATPIREAEIFPPFAMHLLQVGEETGRLDTMLLQIADVYDRELRTALKRLIAFFEPVIILIMGLIIGLIVVSMLYSIFSINDVPL